MSIDRRILDEILKTDCKWSLYTHFRGNKVREAEFDYVVVPGAGADEAGNPSAWACDMLDAAAYAYQRGFAAQVITTGGLSPGDPGPFGYAQAGRIYLTETQGSIVTAEHITELDFARDTIGDVYGLVDAIRTEKVVGNSFLVICPDYQSDRLHVISEHLFGLLSKETKENYEIKFMRLNNPYLPDETLKKRRTKEVENINAYKNDWKKFDSLDDFYLGLKTHHGCYNGVVAEKESRGEIKPALDIKPPVVDWLLGLIGKGTRVGKRYPLNGPGFPV